MRRDRQFEANQWLAYAREDLDAAWAAISGARFAPRHSCFHSQQAAEKAMKAALVFEGVVPPRTHNLASLAALLAPGWDFLGLDVDYEALTLWAAQSRYPSEFEAPTLDDANAAALDASAVLRLVSERFGELL